ncbi:hypothetical protein GY21_19740 [Cryobacterium roopkundense]|uniref:DUF2231 domain-containing protein n=1 Tax=Cryobacterium roopkundense TaxID=1001240 RepID=A0A099J046_9MICO|nr:DUF2231 domain-containing protein [Cryobacterium roopkundense]KGJ71799.1 hypothetical protein GY21_19740 [Cryobacterium roopkundense]MBB5643607.1 hypothetical protein [Cryobacterium roopkundense]
MFDTFFGLPMHPLVVHATEVIVPTAALVVLLVAVWPRFRRWARFLPLGLALAALVLVPISTETGEALEARVGDSALIEIHSELAEGLLPWVIGLVVVAGVMLWRSYVDRAPRRTPKWIAIAIIAAAVITSTGTMVQAIRIGHSGATAVWQEDMGTTPAPSGDSD